MRRLGVGAIVAIAMQALLLGFGASASSTGAGSLPSVPSGARPGPDLLYAAAPPAPQLENVAPWQAAPIMVSGAEAYRQGEFLYQDFLFDDRGATGAADPNDPFNPLVNLFSPAHGTITYPTDTAVFANNAADLVELRVRALARETAFRVTLNTLKDPSRVAFTVALGNSVVPKAWPFGAGVVSPAQFFLTVHGTTAVLADATTGIATPGAAPTASVDMRRRQFDVRIPHSAWNPGAGAVRMSAGVGLWDVAGATYLKPGATASATRPGGCLTTCPALFNMAFRTAEPLPKAYSPGTANTIAEGGVGAKLDGTWWREKQQGEVLASGDVSAFNAMVDFSKLVGAVSDESAVPHTGHFDRIFASRFDYGQGADYTVNCFPSNPTECPNRYHGQLQPYAVYVPNKPVPAAGFGLVLSMHGLSANFNEFLGSHEASEFGDRGTGSVLASPEGRGPDGFYHGYAESDVFEMWADVARNYKLNPDLTDVSGYSMGGEGTYLLSTRWPDLFARAFPTVGPPSSAASYKSLRNVPVMAWYAEPDELVGPELSEQSFQNATNAGIRYDHWSFNLNVGPPPLPVGHITLGNNDEYTPAVNFLGANTVDRNPAHVTYTLDSKLDSVTDGPANHAYWLSALGTRTAGSTGTIDAASHGFGVADPPVLPLALGAGTLAGGSHGLILYHERNLAWGPTPTAPVADRLDVNATNVSAATIDTGRARVDCNVELHITSDGPLTLHLAGCTRTVSVGGGTTTSSVPGSSLPDTGAAVPLGWVPVGGFVSVLVMLGAAHRRRATR